jgi:hypothetical protein
MEVPTIVWVSPPVTGGAVGVLAGYVWHPVLGLVGICILVGRPIDNRPQVANLPHIRQRARLNQYGCPVVGKSIWSDREKP